MRAGLVAFLCGLMAIGPAAGIEANGNTLLLTDLELQTCRQEGGCMLITAQYLRSMLAKTLADAELNARVMCGKTL